MSENLRVREEWREGKKGKAFGGWNHETTQTKETCTGMDGVVHEESSSSEEHRAAFPFVSSDAFSDLTCELHDGAREPKLRRGGRRTDHGVMQDLQEFVSDLVCGIPFQTHCTVVCDWKCLLTPEIPSSTDDQLPGRWFETEKSFRDTETLDLGEGDLQDRRLPMDVAELPVRSVPEGQKEMVIPELLHSDIRLWGDDLRLRVSVLGPVRLDGEEVQMVRERPSTAPMHSLDRRDGFPEAPLGAPAPEGREDRDLDIHTEMLRRLPESFDPLVRVAGLPGTEHEAHGGPGRGWRGQPCGIGIGIELHSELVSFVVRHMDIADDTQRKAGRGPTGR